MTAEEKRAKLIERATELGLTLAKNAAIKTIEDKIRAKEDELALEASKIDDDIDPDLIVDDSETQLIEDGKEVIGVETEESGIEDEETAMRLRLEKEFEDKLAKKAKEIEATYALNASSDTREDSSMGLIKLNAMKKATKLVRCIITNRNPLKTSWEGEIIAVSNDLIGMQRKYVPFSLNEGYHLPQIIVDTLKDKECTVFVNGKTKNGEKVKVGKLIKEFAIEILPPLTANEISNLADDQRARGAIDSE